MILEYGVVALWLPSPTPNPTQRSKERDTAVITVFDVEELVVSQL